MYLNLCCLSPRQAFASDGAEFAHMDATFREHLQQFGDRGARRVADTIPGDAVPKALPQLAIKEDFSNILTTCKKYKVPLTQQRQQQQMLPASQKHTEIEFNVSTAFSEDTAKRPNPGVDSFLLGKVKAGSKSLLFRELDVTRKEAAKTAAANDRTRVVSHNPFHDPSRNQNKDMDSDDLHDVKVKDKGMELTYAILGGSSASTTNNQRKQSYDDDTAKLSVSYDDDIDSHHHVTKYEVRTSSATPSEVELRRLSMPAIRDHIRIPAKLYRRGATYKLEDCYYDDDGEFLYRVPGMTGREV